MKIIPSILETTSDVARAMRAIAAVALVVISLLPFLTRTTSAEEDSKCRYNRNLSTGVAAWTVDGNPAYVTRPLSSWAAVSPDSKWIQQSNAGNPVLYEDGVFHFRLVIKVPDCVLNGGGFVVKGVFAADNRATLKIANHPPKVCLGNSSNNCFLKKHVTQFAANFNGAGPHEILVDVWNNGPSPAGLLVDAKIY